VEQETELQVEASRLTASATSRVVSGAGSGLRSRSEWLLEKGVLRLRSEVAFESGGYFVGVLKRGMEGPAASKAQELMELWWKLAQQRLQHRQARAEPSVQRALSFDQEDVDDDDEEDQDSGSVIAEAFVDASSMLESPSLSSASGMLDVLEREAQNLEMEVVALEQRRIDL
jgi:hypothetical protein